ncbi:hypothetical protein SGRA_2190 [Saprospira grandis str. Lewin]|uniref:Uncharacterized protein n=1 Tax=Saprospira grandis (strain Lewin) TaxID=984262 RepID=H6L392_SAPGL|nr:hypothetical protein SGRA_2190 [Saprospira grandis str. Lewin]
MAKAGSYNLKALNFAKVKGVYAAKAKKCGKNPTFSPIKAYLVKLLGLNIS